MLVCENGCAAVALYLAITSVGAWPAIVNARLSDREIDEILVHSDARRVLYTDSASARAKAHGRRHGATLVAWNMFGEVSIGPLNEGAEAEPVEGDAAQHVAALIYTSGTTGRPKGVMLTHRNLLFVAHEVGRVRHLGCEDRIYAVLPISHILGLTSVVLCSLLHGAQVHFAPRFDPAAVLAALDRDRISIMLGTPSMYALLVEYAARKNVSLRSRPALRIISSAGAPLDAATKAATETAFGLTLHNGYGITETSPTITLTRLEAPRTDCAVGQILPGIETKLAGADGRSVAPGEAGELFVRGPGVMKGYYKAAAETAEVLDRDGWFRTGDRARMEGDNLFIVGRSKELIIRFGFNVYPAEVEGVLNAHPAVARSAVIGRRTGESEDVLAFIELKQDANATVSELAEYAGRHLAPYKRPTGIFLMPSLPATPTGKILKSELATMEVYTARAGHFQARYTHESAVAN
jgi:acyl-CoA synthetase (AMP-forming)/AMP-acid ligase II